MASFFGFDPSKPPNQSRNINAPGFGPPPDAFASLANRNADDEEGEALDFNEDDRLGDTLEETGDAFNDATFGSTSIDNNFDFSGQGEIRLPSSKQHVNNFQSFSQPTTNVPKPTRTGYEGYKRSNDMRALEPDAHIWGLGPPKQQSQQIPQQAGPPSISAATKSMMTLEEVEKMMRAQPKKSSPAPAQDIPYREPQPQSALTGISHQPNTAQVHQHLPNQAASYGQRQSAVDVEAYDGRTMPAEFSGIPQQAVPRDPATPNRQSSQVHNQIPQQMSLPQQTTTQNFPNQGIHRRAPSGVGLPQIHHRGPSLNGQPVTHPDQITQLSEEERAAFLRDEANRAKRNHKIHLLSKDNGLMTPQDKNFITRIQLQQLVTATGGADEETPEAAFAEDFYYQVYSQIYRQRENGLPASPFALSYLNQLSWKGGSRRYPRGGETHMRRMEQQVQRAVEAAKARPKNKQLVVEGSLGKISFSNAKTPKPLLNLKRTDTPDVSQPSNRSRSHETVAGQKAVLKDLEKVYSSVMKIEDCERNHPPQPREESSGDEFQAFMDWRHRLAELNQTLWRDWKVNEPADDDSAALHPFIAMLSHPKGKKLVPRMFRQIDDEQRLTVLTRIVFHLNQLDVVRDVQSQKQQDITIAIKRSVEQFEQSVEPHLFAYIADAALSTVIGLVGIIVERVDIHMALQAQVGVNILSQLLTRAITVIQSGHANAEDSKQWNSTFNRLFDGMEAVFPHLFHSPIDSGDDAYIWRFLATVGILSGPGQQQRLVVGVKDRVMNTVTWAKTLPEEKGKPNLDKVNLFMHAIGLDVDLLS